MEERQNIIIVGLREAERFVLLPNMEIDGGFYIPVDQTGK
jgi:hypothetical protein